MVPSIMVSHSVPEAAKKVTQDPNSTTTMFDCWHDVFFRKCCTPDVTGRTPSKKLNFCFVSPQNTRFIRYSVDYLNRKLKDHQDVWQM